jgi:hypothetical protein
MGCSGDKNGPFLPVFTVFMGQPAQKAFAWSKDSACLPLRQPIPTSPPDKERILLVVSGRYRPVSDCAAYSSTMRGGAGWYRSIKFM